MGPMVFFGALNLETRGGFFLWDLVGPGPLDGPKVFGLFLDSDWSIVNGI